MSIFSPTLSNPLANDRRYLKAELPDAVGLTLEEVSELILAGWFPAAQCHPVYGPSWGCEEVDGWAGNLPIGIDLADCLEMVLGYRRSASSRDSA